MRSLLALATLLMLSTTGCLGPSLRLDELPAERIAVLYWTEAQALVRLDNEKKEAASRRRAGISSTGWRAGVASTDSLIDLFGTMSSGSRRGDEGGALPGADPGRLALVDPRTLEVEIVVAAPRGAQPLAWSRDRERLLFASVHLAGVYELYEYRPRTQEVRRLTFGGGAHPRGDFGPRGALVYSSYAPSDEVDSRSGSTGREPPRVWLQPPGRPAEVLADVFADSVRWSPDGAAIVIGRREMGGRRAGARAFELLVADPRAGSELRPLTFGRDPCFSPDGAWLVYSAPARNGWRLARIRTDGSARSPLGQSATGRSEQMPAVSPDGGYVAFVSEDSGLSRLYVRSFNGSSGRLLLDRGAVSSPVW